MCVLLACSFVSLVITALKPNSLPYVTFSYMISNLVIHLTCFREIPPFLSQVFNCIFGVSFVCLKEK